MAKNAWLPPSQQSEAGLVQPITTVSRVLPGKTRIEAHRHPWGQLLYAEEGLMRVTFEGQRCIVAPQQAIWLQKGIVHQVDCLTNVTLSSFYVDVAEVSTLGGKSTEVVHVDALLHQMIIEAQRKGNQYEWRAHHGRLLALMMERVAQAPTITRPIPAPSSAALSKLVSLCVENKDTFPSIQQLAGHVGLSQRTLSRRFKQETGVSFRTWRQLLTIERAVERLVKGETIKAVALDLGYRSVAAFTHMFKQQMGYPPSLFLNTSSRLPKQISDRG